MNSINFIKSVSAQQEKEVAVWFWLTLLSSSALVIVITTYTTAQYLLYRSVVQEKNSMQQELSLFDTIVAQQRTQTDEQNLLQKRINAVLKYRKSPKNPTDLLKELRAITADGLQSISIAKQTFELQVSCNHAHHTTIYLQRLVHTPRIRTVKLVSLQSNKRQLLALFKGEITT